MNRNEVFFFNCSTDEIKINNIDLIGIFDKIFKTIQIKIKFFFRTIR